MIHSSLFMKIKQLKLVIVLLIDWFVVIQWPLSLDVLMETNFKDSSIQAIVSKGFMLSNTFELTWLSNLVNKWELCTACALHCCLHNFAGTTFTPLLKDKMFFYMSCIKTVLLREMKANAVCF